MQDWSNSHFQVEARFLQTSNTVQWDLVNVLILLDKRRECNVLISESIIYWLIWEYNSPLRCTRTCPKKEWLLHILTIIILALEFGWPTRCQAVSNMLLCVASLILTITFKSKYLYHHSGKNGRNFSDYIAKRGFTHPIVRHNLMSNFVSSSYMFAAPRSLRISNLQVIYKGSNTLLSMSKDCHLVDITHITKTITMELKTHCAH